MLRQTTGAHSQVKVHVARGQSKTNSLYKHAAEFQVAADVFTDCIISLCSDKAITNYIHILRAGHLKEMMETHGYLAYLSNGAPENPLMPIDPKPRPTAAF